jgi:hypothetical protein
VPERNLRPERYDEPPRRPGVTRFKRSAPFCAPSRSKAEETSIQLRNAIAMWVDPVYTLFYVIQPHLPEDLADLLSVLRIRVLWHREASELTVSF